MGLKFGKAVTMIVERYGWSAFDNLSAINDLDLDKAIEMVRKVRKKKDDIHANKPGVDLRRTRPPREKIEKMVDKGMTYAEIGEAIGGSDNKQGVNCMQEQQYAVRVTGTRRMWYVRGDNGQLMARIENGIPHDKSGTWTFEEIKAQGLDQMARIRI